MQRLKCPVCKSEFYFGDEPELENGILLMKKTRPRGTRHQRIINLIYAIVGALLSLAGVSLPGCVDSEVETETCLDCDTDTDTDTGTDKTNTAGIGVLQKNTDAGEQQLEDTGTDSDEQLEDTGTDSDMDIYSLARESCEKMRQFFYDCWREADGWTGPTDRHIDRECDGTFTDLIRKWYLCWRISDTDCQCPNIKIEFDCQNDKCGQWDSCMSSCAHWM